MENYQWLQWVWGILALLLLIAEIFVSGFVLVSFAAGAAAAALSAFLGYGVVWQLGAFISVTLATVLLMRPFADRVTRASGPNSVGIDRVLGKPAVVLIAVDPIEARGRVRVDREEWQATSSDGLHIPVGAQVQVLGVVGTRLVVRQTAPPPPPAPPALVLTPEPTLTVEDTLPEAETSERV
jgi:membrane protein implicated in regulation of membrane protease activity